MPLASGEKRSAREEALAAAGAAIGKAKKKARGRKDNSGQEMAIDYDGLKEDYPALKKCYQKFLKIAEEFGNQVKERAEARNANAGVVKRWLKASCDGKFEERRRKAEQESDLFGMGNPDPDATN